MIHYNIAPLWEKGEELKAPFIGAIGGKGNGKTYSAIHKAIEKFFKDNRPFVYLRRLKEMVQKGNLQTLINPHLQDIVNLSKGKYNAVKYVSNTFILYNSDNKKVQPLPVCYTRSLATLESQTGADLGELSCVIYDEMLSRERELKGEFDKLIIAHSNFIRNRTHYYCPFILLGNTFTRDSDLLQQFGISPYNIKQGDIAVSKSRSGEIRLLLEYCDIAAVQLSADKAYYARFDNDRIKMVTHGNWVMSSYVTMLQNYKTTKPIATVAVQSAKSRRIIDICIDNTLYVHIHKPTENDNEMILLISAKPVKTLKCNTVHIIPNIPLMSTIIKCIAAKRIYCDEPDSVEMLRDILNDIAGGESIRKYLE